DPKNCYIFPDMRALSILIAAITLSLFIGRPAMGCDQSSGEVTSVDTAKNCLVIAAECSCGSGKTIETTFTLKESTKVLLNGKEAKLADLKTGDKVDVEYEETGDVIKISATRE